MDDAGCDANGVLLEYSPFCTEQIPSPSQHEKCKERGVLPSQSRRKRMKRMFFAIFAISAFIICVDALGAGFGTSRNGLTSSHQTEKSKQQAEDRRNSAKSNPHFVSHSTRQPALNYCCQKDNRDENGLGEIVYYYRYSLPYMHNELQSVGHRRNLLSRAESDAHSRASKDKKPKTGFHKTDSGYEDLLSTSCLHSHIAVYIEFSKAAY